MFREPTLTELYKHTKRLLMKRYMRTLSLSALVSLASVLSHSETAQLNYSHAIAMHGDIKYPAAFTHFDYTIPNAPKYGRLKLAAQGTFDSLNIFISKGHAGQNIDLIYDTLTVASQDEPFTHYGLIAKSITWPTDRSFVEYELRPEAKFSDGHQLTAEDVKFSFDMLMEKAAPGFRTQYADVKSVQIISKHKIRFEFSSGANTELVLIVGQIPILPKHATDSESFDKSSLEIPLGSGPYIIDSIAPGKRILFKRNPNYWARDLNVNKGRYNFELIQLDYYRDSTVMLEALKANEYDFRYENVSKLWATAYKGSALASGRLIKENIPHKNPTGMQAFVLNQRNPLFNDIRVRKALAYAFDFEWTNRQLFYDAYKRSYSYFTNSELASSGLPSDAELTLLNPLKDKLPDSVFNDEFSLPITSGTGNNRPELRQAKKLLEGAGWHVVNNQLVNNDGTVFSFEFLVFQPSFERVINPYIKNLKRLGIQASIRKVEISQYINRLREFNYDVITSSYPQSLSPGIEQEQFWGSQSAKTPASRNYIGIENEAIDQLIDHVTTAHSREDLVVATQALDRALLHHWYVIPQWYIDSHRVAYWNKFGKPDIAPPYDGRFSGTLLTWWVDKDKEAALNKRQHKP